MEQISPELVLVDPELAAVERPREWWANEPVQRIVPLGVPLSPAELPAGGPPAWLVALLLLSLLTSGFLVSLLLFRTPRGHDRPTVVQTVTLSSPGDAGRSSRDLHFQTKTSP
jgi:hypothetical protein